MALRFSTGCVFEVRVEGETVWSRAAQGRFQGKDLKQIVRDRIAPCRGLGHSDRQDRPNDPINEFSPLVCSLVPFALYCLVSPSAQEALQVGFNAQYLLEFLSAARGTASVRMQLKDGESAAAFRPSGDDSRHYRYVLMSLRS